MSVVADKLREARVCVAGRWIQGTYADDCGGVCIYGALQKAVLGEPDDDWTANEELTAAESLLADAIGTDRLLLSYWNDQPERTKAEVLAAFDKAIELAEAQDA
jgi:hypothetical protein